MPSDTPFWKIFSYVYVGMNVPHIFLGKFRTLPLMWLTTHRAEVLGAAMVSFELTNKLLSHFEQ